MAFFGFSDTDCFAAPDFTNYLKNFRPKAEQDEIDREQNERIAKLEQGGAGGVGTDGGYYSPNVDNDGNLTWTASADNMPAVTGANIKGPQGNKGETGATGAQGPAGADGQPGADGVTPNIQIGTVETLTAGSDATASITGTAQNPLLNLGIPKGADGTGESITDEQVRSAVDNYVNEHGLATGATTEQAAQIEQNTRDISSLSEENANTSNVVYTKNASPDTEYIIGGIGSSGTANNNNNRVRINNFVFAKAGSKISVDDGYKFNIALYSSADRGTMIVYRGFATDPYVLDTDAYFRASIATTDDSVQSDTSIGTHFVFDIITGSIVDDINDCAARLVAAEDAIAENESKLITFSEPDNVEFVLGGIGTGGTTNNNAARVRMLDFMPVSSGATVSVDDPTLYKFNVAEYSDADVNTNTAYRTFGTAEYKVQADGYIRASIARMDDSVQSDTTISRHLVLKTVKKSVFERIDSLEGKSDFKKSIRFGTCALQQYYRTGAGDYSLFAKNTTSADYYAAFSELAAGYSEYCAITNLGNGSDGNPLYLYDFKPISFESVAELTDIPKIIIISGQHGFEKCSCYGLYYFVRDLLKNWQNNPTLDYIRNHVHLMILPCVNRYGFDNLSYKNANGVNLNRNYSVGFTVGTVGTDDYGGAAAFDQPETQVVRDLVAANTDALLFLDFHTNGSTNVTDWTKCNWHSFSPGVLEDDYYKNLYYASGYHITTITAHFIDDYVLSTDGHQCGSVSTDTNADAATAKAWAESIGIMSLTFEGFNGFPSENSDYSDNTQRANAELIGNYIASVLSVFARIAN